MELFELDINALSKGKKEAFFILYKKFFVALCLFAQKFSIGKEAAEDIVQEIFYKLYEERQIFHNILTLQSYLYSSVKNSCLNYIRDEKRRKLRESYYLRGVYRIVHKKLERKCERKACKYKEFERFEGDLGKKNEMYTGLICFNLV